jgi:hypothetical protein
LVLLCCLLSCAEEKAGSGPEDTDDTPVSGDSGTTQDSGPPADTSDSGPVSPTDQDGDGFDESEDCDDTDPDVSPDATEVCDGVDNDCDDEVDEDDAADVTTWYLDSDGDGFGVEADTVTACDAPSGYVAESKLGFDCDDTDQAHHPGATEDDCADPNDYNCDGSVSYEDADEDGWAACEE